MQAASLSGPRCQWLYQWVLCPSAVAYTNELSPWGKKMVEMVKELSMWGPDGPTVSSHRAGEYTNVGTILSSCRATIVPFAWWILRKRHRNTSWPRSICFDYFHSMFKFKHNSELRLMDSPCFPHDICMSYPLEEKCCFARMFNRNERLRK